MSDFNEYLNTFGNSETVFSDEMNQELASSQFYAQPKNTELRMNFGNDKPFIIGNAVVMNTEFTDEKIPIYSYNSDLFQKFLKGKSVITGVIALRKTTVDKIISLIKTKDFTEDSKNRIKDLEDELEIIKELINNDENKTYFNFYNTKQEQIKNKIIELEDVNNNSFSKKYERESSNIKADLLYYNNFTSKNNAVLTICYKDDFIEEVDTITDILFTRKQTEINVGRNDIVEIYHFIGNPSRKIGG